MLLKTLETNRAALVISGLNINVANIRVFDDKPFLDGGKKTERVVIKDLPATIPPRQNIVISERLSSRDH